MTWWNRLRRRGQMEEQLERSWPSISNSTPPI